MEGFAWTSWFVVIAVLLGFERSSCEGNGIYSFTMKDIKGDEVPLSIYRGKVSLSDTALCAHGKKRTPWVSLWLVIDTNKFINTGHRYL